MLVPRARRQLLAALSAAAAAGALAVAGCAEPAAVRAAPASPRSAASTGAGAGGASSPAGPAPAGAGAGPAAPAAGPERRASLQYQLNDRAFPSPLIDAVVAGQPAVLIVDTGASHHVLARWLADELALPLSTAGDVAVDHAGRPLAVSRLENASLALSGWGRVEVSALLVVRMPDVLQRIGIGGILAPQELAGPGRAVVLDLREGRMTEAPRDEAARTLRARFGEAAIVELARCGGPNQGSGLTARASVEGIDVTLKIDSGASQSSLFAVSPAGKRLSRRATGDRSAYAASGRHTVPVLSGARLRMAGFDAAADIDLLPGERQATCPSDGFAGMDVLRTCVLVLAEDGGVAACAPR
ncbi:retropepsin-like aspartic protease [Sorangium atrum]|uniref:Retropepsin-like aspartic protease n=1 Tax=Sorangium atrum TaxID=2995308 RepID=A0ABT5C2V6_9BACT|nr:retropepsin-like aspartic protease [Sorangium aterium]MDC0680667.1 retropepsin-like aspartic protease [Sorangium aterium]